jgi:hypothetical protein
VSLDLDDIVGGAAGEDEVIVDFSGAIDFDALPKGRYNAKVLKAEPGASKSGNPKIKWTFGITDAAFAGRQVIRHTPTTGKGSGLTKQVLKAIGLAKDGEQIRFRPSEAIGKECQVDLIIQLDDAGNETDFNEVKKVLPPAAAASPLG